MDTNISQGLTIDSLKDSIIMDSIIMLAENIERIGNNEAVAYTISEFETQAEKLKIYNQSPKHIYEVFPQFVKQYLSEFNESDSNNIIKHWYYEFENGIVTLEYAFGDLIGIKVTTNNKAKQIFDSQELWQLLCVNEFVGINILQNQVNNCINTYKEKYNTLLSLIS